MAASYHDFTIDQGSTFQRTLTWKDSDGTPIDLTEFTARMQIRRTLRSEEVLVEMTTENGYIELGGAEGTIMLTIPADVTKELVVTRGVYDIELESVDGIVTRLLQGCVIISPEVTR